MKLAFTIEIPLPSYATKTKKGIRKQTTLSLNAYRNLNYHVLNKIKRDYGDLYYTLLNGQKELSTPVLIKYTLFMNNSGRDLLNYGCMVDKIFCDSMKKKGLYYDDNVKYVTDVSFKYGGKGDDYCVIQVFDQ
ncbi:MAG: hypothetical protein ACE1ZQ_09355 [Ignavibacteriaceae bacterium]